MESIWHTTAKLPHFPSLQGDVQTDVLIIGGGLAGILTAYHLRQAGISYLLVERDRICSGVTGDTTAKLTVQHGLIYQKIQKSYGFEAAKKYYDVNNIALRRYRELAKNIDCDFCEKDNFVYSQTNDKVLRHEAQILQKIGCDAEFSPQVSLPITVKGAVKVPHQGQFHPLKFVNGISKGLNIFENTFVYELLGNTAVTNRGKIKANRIVVATHFPFLNKHGFYFMKQYQHRSYVIALKDAPDVKGMYVDDSETGLSFRNEGAYLLLGGGGHRTGKQGGNWEELRSFAKKQYPHAKEEFRWATQDCISLDGMPYIGRYSKSTPNIFVATGFNKWGMTSSMVASMILSDLLSGKQNEYAELYDPSRSMLKPKLFVNGFESVLNLLTPSAKRCPHLGCALKWNPAERSWDCPCHGSRFSEEGQWLDNPANDDLNPSFKA